jgi:hypothetical protein
MATVTMLLREKSLLPSTERYDSSRLLVRDHSM